MGNAETTFTPAEQRFMAACYAMQGLLAGTDMRYAVGSPGALDAAAASTAKAARAFADALLTALAEPPPLSAALRSLSQALPADVRATLDLPPACYDQIAALPGAVLETSYSPTAGGNLDLATAAVGRVLVQTRRPAAKEG